MSETAAGRRYGRALFLSARERGEADQVEEELAQIVELLKQEPRLARFLDSPRVSEKEKGAFLQEQLGKYSLPITIEFLRLLIAKGRLGELEGIFATFHRLLQEERGEVEATVVTARRTSDEILEELRRRLARLTGKKIILHHREDPAILGGMAVYLGEKVIDGSLRTRLSRLRDRLFEVRVH